MQIIITIGVKILEWILLWGGKALYEYVNKIVDKKKQEAIDKENLKRYKENIKKGASDADTLQDETDLINGTRRK
jgi:hypothetical protein